MPKRDLVIRVAGEAGEGVLSTGQLITQAAARAGFGVLTDSVPPAEIKGGHSFFQIRLSDRRLYSRGDALDILLAFNEEAYTKNIRELEHGGLLIFDSAEFTPPESNDYRSYALPLTDMAKNQLQFELAKNVIAVGAVAALFGLKMDFLNTLIEERFGRKGEEILGKNLRALELGRRFIEEHIPDRDALRVQPSQAVGDMMVVSGNQALGVGTLVAGCRRYAGYPITPATDIMEFLAAELPKIGGAVVQAEDEIAAIGMVLGASYAGFKTMTATSGPGLSLMTEMLGLAAMAEIPCVIVDAQRAGPSTGMPTRHEQADLLFCAFGGHGELPRLVLAPASVADCFTQAVNAFNLSEQFQTPVILLTDTVLAVRSESVPKPDLDAVTVIDRARYSGFGSNGNGANRQTDERYLRYKLTEDGISPMAIPGTAGGQHVATGLEHNEAGRPRYDSKTHMDMTRKRFDKLQRAVEAAPPAHRYGDPTAEVGIITWGSTWGVVVEAVDAALEAGIKVDAIAPRLVWPIPDHQLRPFLEGKTTVLVPEVNYTGQFAQLLQAHFRRDFQHVNVFGGAPFKVAELLESIQGVQQRVSVR